MNFVNFHEFYFYMLNLYFNYSFSIKTMSISRATLDRVEIRNLARNIKTKLMKVVIFKKQIFCSRFIYKNHESSGF